MSRPRDWLVLARASNLPTVWADVLAGWCLGGAGNPLALAALGFGGSLLYTGGMFLNDVADVEFDRRHRSERPIAQGRISRRAALTATLVLFAAGLLLLGLCGVTTALIGLGLVACIVLYDLVHKKFRGAPILMAACRFLLFLAAAAGGGNVSPFALACAAVLAIYVAGISAMARHESTGSKAPPWPILLLLAPGGFALAVHAPTIGLALGCGVFFGWILFARRLPLGVQVARMLAGIALVDALLAAPMFPQLTPLFAGLFLMALAFQRFIPAT